MATNGSNLSKAQRLVLGTLLLFAVTIIWSASAELTDYLFKHEKFNKPFFTTYIKNSMFILYLLGFLCYQPWQHQCSGSMRKPILDPNIEDETQQYSDNEAFMGESRYQPLNYHSDSEKSSVSGGDDSDIQVMLPGRGSCSKKYSTMANVGGSINSAYSDLDGTNSITDKSSRSVKFNRVTEVRHLSESHAEHASLARLSYQATVRAQQEALRVANKLPVKFVAKLAVIFCFLWFGAQLSYQEALLDTHPGVVQVLASTSSLFTLIMAAIFPSSHQDKFTLSKLIAVLCSCGGVVLVTLSDVHIEDVTFPPGAIWALCSALFYAIYLVFIKRKAGDESRLDIPMFFGFVGLFNLLILWPGFFLLHATRQEIFEWPNKEQVIFLAINGLIGTVLSELLWLWACFLTSSLIATLSLSLTIPLTMFADILLKNVSYGWMFYVGTIPVVVSFLAVTLFAHWDNWDPCLLLLKCCLRSLCRCCYCRIGVNGNNHTVPTNNMTNHINNSDMEQSESLLTPSDISRHTLRHTTTYRHNCFAS